MPSDTIINEKKLPKSWIFITTSITSLVLGFLFGIGQMYEEITIVFVTFCILLGINILLIIYFILKEKIKCKTMLKVLQFRLSNYVDTFVQVKWPFLTITIIIIHVAIYVLMVQDGGMSSNLWIQMTGNISCYQCKCLKTEWDWSIIIGKNILNFPPPRAPTHFHLIGNMILIAIYGSYLESMIGRFAMIILYTSVILTNTYLYNGCNGVGSSGILYAFIGATWAVFFGLRHLRWYRNDEPIALKIGYITVYLILIYITYSFAYFKENIHHLGHGIGFVFGLLVTLGMSYMMLVGHIIGKSKIMNFFVPTPEQRIQPIPHWHLILTILGFLASVAFCVVGYLNTFHNLVL